MSVTFVGDKAVSEQNCTSTLKSPTALNGNPLFVRRQGISIRNYCLPVVAAIEVVVKAAAVTPMQSFFKTGAFVVFLILTILPMNISC